MQEDNRLEIVLKDNILKAEANKVQEVMLIIPPDIFNNKFGQSFSELQDYLKTLCSKYRLEISATNGFHSGVKVIFRKDEYYYEKEDNFKQLE